MTASEVKGEVRSIFIELDAGGMPALPFHCDRCAAWYATQTSWLASALGSPHRDFSH